jgi:putative hemolysin
MMSSTLVPILIVLLLSAFFSGVEIAFVSANRLMIELEVKKGSLSAKIISGFMKNPGQFISSMLVGNNIALVVYGILMGDLIVHLLQLETYTSSAGSMLIQTIISTLIILVAGEFVPKALFRLHPNAFLNFFALPLFFVYYVVLFIPSSLFSYTSDFVLKLFRLNRPKEEIVFGRIDLDQYLHDISSAISKKEEVNNELEILKNALDFNKIKARDCMIPRPEVEAMEVEGSIEKLRETFIESGYSKILIYRDNIDNIIGYVHCNELFNKPASIKTILLPVSIVPETMTAQEVLENFIAQRRALAVVVDEHGGTSGIITMEDIVEEIFGEIEDEHDQEKLIEEVIDESQYKFSGRLEVDYLNDKYALDLPDLGDYDTLAGYIIHHTENIPKENTRVVIGDYQFNITKVSGTRIEEVVLKTNT